MQRRVLFTTTVLLLAIFCLTVLATTDGEETSDVDQLWSAFKQKFSKSYNDVNEETKRRELFLQRNAQIDEHNALYEKGKKSYRMELNHIADWTEEERKSLIGPVVKPPHSKSGDGSVQEGSIYKRVFPAGTYLKPENVDHSSVPKSLDWREHGYVTPVKNQARCGSCWAFSTVGALEGQWWHATGQLKNFSEQQLVDCAGENHYTNGCHGGFVDWAYQYIIDNGGIETNETYPYEGVDGECRFNNSNIAATVVGFANIRYADEEEQRIALATKGPLAFLYDVEDAFFYYNDGVYFNEECDPDALNHAMLVVGYGTDEAFGDYWLIKNSWTERWGVGGYAKVARNRGNNCGVASWTSFPYV